jgi:hypothetical protein
LFYHKCVGKDRFAVLNFSYVKCDPYKLIIFLWSLIQLVQLQHVCLLLRYDTNKICCNAHPDAPLIEDYRAGDQICSECGLVVGDRLVKLTVLNLSAITYEGICYSMQFIPG